MTEAVPKSRQTLRELLDLFQRLDRAGLAAASGVPILPMRLVPEGAPPNFAEAVAIQTVEDIVREQARVESAIWRMIRRNHHDH